MCSSDLKVLEYGVLGVPVIAADSPPYQHCPVTLAAPGDVEEWTARIRELLARDELRIEQGRVLKEWVRGNHLMQHRRSEWSTALGIARHDNTAS